jgi:hypothetical protein
VDKRFEGNSLWTVEIMLAEMNLKEVFPYMIDLEIGKWEVGNTTRFCENSNSMFKVSYT